MSSWAKSPGSGRRPQSNPNGSVQPLRNVNFRRPAPYPMREDRTEEHKVLDALESYEQMDQKQLEYSGKMQYEGYQHQQNAKTEACSPADKRKTLYQKFYRQVQEERRPADCVVLSVTNQCMDYPKSLGQCLQERGLSVEMLYLQAESGLTRALQDIRADGSPLCILVEQTNVALSSCTVIIFSESLKIHRNMPKDQALDFVMAEYRRRLVNERPARDPAEMAARASELLDDFLEREKIERHAVPSDTRQLLLLLAEGVHLYTEELGTIAEYLRSRQHHSQASSAEGERGNMLPPGLGKPPPLLPTPSSTHAPLLPTPPGPPPPTKPGLGVGGPVEHHQLPHSPPTPLMASPASYPKTKPPPLLSMHRASGPSHGAPAPLGPVPPRGPPSSHGPYGPPPPRGPPHHHAPPYHPGPRGPRGTPPSLKSLHMGLTGGPLPRPNGPRR